MLGSKLGNVLLGAPSIIALGGADTLLKTFLFDADSIDPEFIFTRSDSVSTVRNSAGNLVMATANTPRFDYNFNGTRKGFLIEGSRQNKCTGFNLATSTTNIVAGGTGAALTIVDRPTELAAAGLNTISGGKCFRATSTGTGTFTIGGTVGNANTHACTIWARAVTGTGDIRLSGTSSTTVISGSTFQRYTLIQTPSSTSSQLRVVTTPNSVVEFLLFQLEEGVFPSSEIIVAGAAATRQTDNCTIANINLKPYFDQTKGFMSCLYSPKASAPAVQYLLVADDGSTANTIGVRYSNSNDGYVRGFVQAGSTSKHTFQIQDRPQLTKDNNCLVTWKSGESIIAGNGAFDRRAYSGDPAGITTFRLGSRNSGQDGFFGYIKRLTIGREFSVLSAVKPMLIQNEFNVIAAGQSNIDNEFDVETAGTPLGKEALISVIQTTLPTQTCRYGQGATGGTCLLKTSASGGTNYWYNDTNGTFDGDAFRNWLIAFNALGSSVKIINWDQGEGDISSLKLGTITIANYSAGLVALFAEFRRYAGNVPIAVTPLGRRTDVYSAGAEWQLLREFQLTIPSIIANTYLAPEKFDLAMLDPTGVTDGVHLADASYVTNAQRQARKDLAILGLYSGAVDGANIVSAVRSGLSITVTLAQASGTDFIPVSAIQGFKFFYGSGLTEISIAAAVRTNATTITLTLASLPLSGQEKLYYGYGVMSGIDNTKLVLDNSAFALPLRSYAGVIN